MVVSGRSRIDNPRMAGTKRENDDADALYRQPTVTRSLPNLEGIHSLSAVLSTLARPRAHTGTLYGQVKAA